MNTCFCRFRSVSTAARAYSAIFVVASALLLGACSGGAGGGPETFTVGGTISGLDGTGLVLENNLGDDLDIAGNGHFAFTTAVASGNAYSITVKTQPTNVWQTCTVTSGSGSLASSNVSSVGVSCVTNTYAVGGAVNGLAGAGLVLENNAADDLSVSSSGSFTFPSPVASGKNYGVTVNLQPTSPSQTCTQSGATGTIAGAAITNVAVSCVTNTYSVGGAVTGLVGRGLVLQDNLHDNLAIAGNGTFRFPTAVASGAPFSVSALTQPGNPAQFCTVSGGAGSITNGNISSVAVSCAAPVVQCGQPNGVVIQHASNVVADQTWSGAGTTHVVTTTISVAAPATLKIEKCALVQLKAGVQIKVEGGTAAGSIATLLVAGEDATSGMVYFSNADANKPWGALDGLNANSHIQLNFTQLAGGGATSAGTRNATIEMHGTSISTPPDPMLGVNTVKISHMQGAAIYLDNAAFTQDSQLLTISDSPDYPIALSAMATGSIPTYTGVNNPNDEALIVGNANIFADLTIHKRLPIHFRTDSVSVAGGAPTFASDITLTLDPGVVLRFEKASTTPTLVTFGTEGQTVDQNAALIANGTAADPILFTSGAPAPAPGDWAGIWLLTSNRSLLQNVIFEFAGGDADIGPINCGPYDSTINQQARYTAPLLVGDGTDQQYIPPANLITGSTFRSNTGNFAIDSVWENQSRAFGPSLHNDNVFSSTGSFCPQSKNLIPLGCTIGGVDESGCQ